MKLLHIFHNVELARFLTDYKKRNIEYIRGAKRLRSSAPAEKENVSQ